FDPRGMEQSDRPHEPDSYASAKMAGDVLALLDAVGVKTGHFYGYSRGGRVGYELALNHGGRIESVIVGAMHPYRRDPAQFTEQIEMFQMGWERSIPFHEQRNGPLDPGDREQLLRNDSQALAASSIAARDDPGFDEALGEIRTPMMIFAGDRDESFYGGSRAAANAIPGARFVCLEGIDHGESFHRSDLVAPLIHDWLFQTG
ncbi:MAG: alpha/beta fold hydrolase, partial [Thermomicrobiales bacterium]